jgi:GntR family transcriptional regulator, transcriptional repressor for pyruvate dehydrogenase complex
MKRSSHKPSRGGPEQLADRLMLRIFRGEFAPGERLPSERQLAAQCRVDRTTLRMALKQLSRMGLLEARHGSGIRVKDYRLYGGLDVLGAMFALDALPLEGSFIVEALDFWLECFALIAAKAIVRMSLEEMRGLEHLLDQAIAAGDDGPALLAAELALQDELARLSGSVLFRMLNNSTRSLRVRLMRLLPETTDVRPWLEQQKQLLRQAALGRPDETAARTALVAALRTLTAGLRERLLFGKPKKLGR